MVYGDHKLVHRTIMEWVLGRELIPPELVHHINYNKADNRRQNLMLCADDQEHRLVHARQDIINDGADPDTQHYCTYHKTYHLKSEFSTSPKSWSGLHNVCRSGSNEYRKSKGLNTNKFNWAAYSAQQYRRAKKNNVEMSWLDKEGRRQ